VFVLRVEFSDVHIATTTSLAVTESFFQRVSQYFSENSYGVFVPTFTVSPTIYTLSSPLAYYGANSGSLCPGDVDNVVCGVDQLFTDARTAAAGLDLSAFDHLMIYHAGYGEETTSTLNPNNLWSLYLGGNRTMGGHLFQGFTLVPERELGADPLGVLCHEYGHQIGLPDLYDTGTGESTIGTWELMDYPWAGSPSGSNPPHLGAWSKLFLGFTSAVPVSTGSVSFLPVETSPDVRHLHAVGMEYFLAEYRTTFSGSFDHNLPQSSGLALWHIDDAIMSNATLFNNNIVNAPSLNLRGHRGVDMVEVDGVEARPPFDLGAGNALGNGQLVSSPQTDLFTGTPSSLAITNVSGAGTGTLTATVSFVAAGSNIDVARLANYPNPAGPRSLPRSGAPPGTVTTIQCVLARPVPSNDFRLTLFSLEGRRVRSVSGGAFRFRSDTSTDGAWVFEYDWDGRNESGEEVPSGIYWFHINVDGRIATGKLALER
jgi:M6 family metalloprotease-like protein